VARPAALYDHPISPHCISPFSLLFRAWKQSGKYSSCKTGQEVRGHTRGAMLARCRIYSVSSSGTELNPQVPPKDPTGFCGHSSQWSPQQLLQESHLTSLALQSVLLQTRTVACIHKLAPSYDLNTWLWGQQKCANIFGKSSCSVCADLRRSLTLHRR